MVSLINKALKRGDYGWEVDVRDRLCFCRCCFQPHDWYHDDTYICATRHRQGCTLNIPAVNPANHDGKRICKRCGSKIEKEVKHEL
mgnify:CR=1 FL=1